MTRPPPFKHQTAVSKIAVERKVFAYLLEQGCGKTRIEIDVAFELYERGEIDALVVLAPNGVHTNWVNNELPFHAPHDNWRALAWRSNKATQVGFKNKLLGLLQFKGFAILTMNIDAIMTTAGKKYLAEFFKARTVRMGIDEATVIKTPRAKRTRAAILLGQKAHSRWIMTGTPVTQGPLDVYAPFRFLDPAIIGYINYTSFKNQYGVWIDGFNGATGITFKRLVGYRNIPELQAALAPHSSRLTKTECLDLPPKLYERRYFDLKPETRQIYNKLRDEFILELEGGDVPVPLALTRLLRLQQIICGPERLAALVEILDGLQGKAIIWARFRNDIDDIMDVAGWGGAVRYDGRVDADARLRAIDLFQDKDGPVSLFVANPHAGGHGLTLHAATNVIYYSNDFSLEIRLQSEDRAHRIGQYHPVTYWDLIATDTIDTKIVDALRNKKNVAEAFTEGLK